MTTSRRDFVQLSLLAGSAVGLGLGTWLVFATNLVDQSGIVSIILVVLVYGIATGWVISWLPASPRETESNTG